jgi:type VI secretion system secreted protein Hcp
MKPKHSLVLTTLAVVWLAPPHAARAQQPRGAGATTFFVTIVTQGGTRLSGESLRGGQQGKIEGIKFFYQVSSPRDVATGQATGRRQYSPITFTKEWGAASPQLVQAAVTNEVLRSVTFEFVKTNLNGKEITYETITLTNATVASIKRYIAIPIGTEPPDQRALEDVSLTFQKIEIKNAVAGTASTDTWATGPLR